MGFFGLYGEKKIHRIAPKWMSRPKMHHVPHVTRRQFRAGTCDTKSRGT